MKTTIERESPTKMKLMIEVEGKELAPIYSRTLKRLAGEINIPGFRKGKVPAKVLESKVGDVALKEELLRDALPLLYTQAVQAESIEPVSFPELNLDSFVAGESLSFTAVVDVRPEVNLPEYKEIEVEKPTSVPTEEEINQQIEVLRERFGTLEAIGRNSQKGDYVTIDLQAYQHDKKIDEASASDLLYEVGSGSLVPKLDEEVEDKRAGDILKFNATLPEGFGSLGGQDVSFSVVVKDVQAKILPEVDDEFAKTSSEFDTLEELKADLAKHLEQFKEASAMGEVRGKILEDLVDRTDIPLPESMVEAETSARYERLNSELSQAGLTLQQYLQSSETSAEQLNKNFRAAAERAVSAQLVLEAIAESEGIEVSRKDLDSEIEALAARTDLTPEKLREELGPEREAVLAGDILRKKALDFLVEHAKIQVPAS